MKIVLIIHSLKIGGMERVMSILANQLSLYSCATVYIVLIGRAPIIKFQLNERVKLVFPDFDFAENKRIFSIFKTSVFIRKTLRRIQPDTVLSFGEIWNNLVLISLLFTKHKVYISDRSQPNKDLGFVNNLLRRLLYPSASGFVAQTEYSALNAKHKNYSKRIITIPNPIKGRFYSDYNPQKRSILFVGRLLPTKNIDKLIQMFVEINDLNWKLIICGGEVKNGSLKFDLSKLVSDSHMEENVIFTGEVLDTKQFLNEASIFAFPSTSEGFPNALGEAIVHGIPSIAFDCIAGPSDIIEDGVNGFLVENGNYHEFKNKMRILMENSDLRKKFHLNCRMAEEKFAERTISDKYYKFILN